MRVIGTRFFACPRVIGSGQLHGLCESKNSICRPSPARIVALIHSLQTIIPRGPSYSVKQSLPFHQENLGCSRLVSGAPDFAAWGVVDKLLRISLPKIALSKVTALVSRPFDLANLHCPRASPSRPKLDVVTNGNIAEDTIQVFTPMLREEVEASRESRMPFTSVRWHSGHTGVPT